MSNVQRYAPEIDTFLSLSEISAMVISENEIIQATENDLNGNFITVKFEQSEQLQTLLDDVKNYWNDSCFIRKCDKCRERKNRSNYPHLSNMLETT